MSILKKICFFSLAGILFFSFSLFSLHAAELPRILNITLGNITKDSAVVRWESNHFQYICTVYYSTSPTSFEERLSGTLVGSGAISSKKDLVVPYEATLQGLSSNQLYFYKVICTSSDGGSAESGIQSFSTLGQTPISINNLSLSSITDQSAVVSWEVSQSSTECEVLYGTREDQLENKAQGESSASAGWKASLRGLFSNTKYFYKVACSLNHSSFGETSVQEFTTQDIALQISNILETNVHASDGIIRWDTNSPLHECALSYGVGNFDDQVSGSLIHYGDSSKGEQSTFEAILSRLLPDTIYSYVITCSGRNDAPTKSSVRRFSTLSDVSSKISEFVQITTLRVYNITEDAATINWDAGSPLYSCVLIYGDTPSLSSSALARLVQYATVSNDGRNIYESQLRGLKTDTHYYYKVSCSVGIGLFGGSEKKEFTTLGGNEKYASLFSDVPQISSETKKFLLNFISFGVDKNTRALGEGERAAVLYSYQIVYGVFPETEEQKSDFLKIAAGRWPSERNEARETEAKNIFQKIYLRDAQISNSFDYNALIIMTYGIRQRAENRNLSSERRALSIYREVFQTLPQTTAGWNILQAIAYSGAQR